MYQLTDLKWHLACRLEMAELYEKQGLIPGQLDSHELIELRGRIMEIKKLMTKVQEYIDELN